MISFELTDEQKMIRDTVASFAQEQIRPAARAADESGAIPEELIAKSWELGLVMGPIPEQFGGYGDARSAVTGAIVAEELGWGDVSISIHLLAPRLLAFPIAEMGTDEQRAEYLRPLAGNAFAAASAAVMEPAFDFDPLAMRAEARREGSGFVLNGAKCLVPLASDAQTILVYATSHPGQDFGAVDALLVPRTNIGLEVSSRERNMGFKPLQTFELTFDNCRLGPEARVGGERGINFVRLLSEMRVAMAALGVGLGRAAFEYARDYAKERRAFGVPIATKQAVAFMLAEMAIEIDAMRLLVWEAASRLDKGDDALKESTQARNYAAASALAIADNAVQVLGGHGYIREHPVEMWLRNARGFAMLDGLAIV